MARERIRSSPSAGEESDDPLDVIERPSRPTPVRPSPSVPAPRPSQVRSPVHNDSYAGAKRRKLSSSASESDSSSGSRSERSVSRSPTPVSNRSKTQRRQQDLSSSDVEAESRAGRARVSPVKARASRVVISDDEEEGPALHGSSAHEVPRAGTEGDVGMEPAKPDQPLSHNEADLGDSTVSDAVDAIATDTQEDVASRGSQFEADDGSDLADPAVDEKGDAGERATLIGTENEETPPTSETQLPIAAAEYMQMTATEDVGSRVPQVGQPYADGSFPSPAKKAAELLGDHQHQPTQDILVEGGGGVRDIDPELGPDVPPAGPVSAEQSPEVAVANDNSHQAAPHEMEVDTAESFPAAVTANPNVDPASDRAADAEATVANITIEPALEDAAVSAAFASSSPTPTHLAATPVPDPVAENQLDAATSSAPIVPGISPLEANTNTSTAPPPAAARPATVSISTPTVPPSIEEMNYGFTDTGRPILGYTATGRPILGKAVTTAVTTGDPGLSGGGSPSGSTMASVTGKGESSTAKEKEKARKAKVAALAKEKEAARVQAALEKDKERERERSREVEMGLGREEKEVGRKDQEGKESKGKGKGKKSKVEDLKGKARSTSTSTTSAKASSPSHTASSSPTPTPSATSTPEPTKAPSSNKNKTAADRGSSVVQPPVQVVSEEEEEEDDEIYCSCGKTGREDGNDDLLACDACDHWFHAGCVGMKAGDLERIDSFICQSCEKLTSQRTTFKKACARPACDVSFAGRQSKYCSSTCGLKHARSLIATLPPKSLPELASSLADFPSPPPEVKIIDHAAFPDPYLPSASISPLESDPIAFQPQSTLSTGTVLAALQRQLESIRAQLDTTLKRQSLVQGLLERCDALPPLSATAPPVPASAEEIRKKDKNKSKSKTKGASASGGGSDDRPCGWISVVLWDDEDINGWDGEMPAVPDLPPVGAGLDEQTDGGGDVDEQGAAAAGKGEARMREIRAIRDSMGDWDWCDRPRKRCDRHNGWQKTAPLLLEREAEDLSGRVDLLEAQLEASRQAQEAEQRGKDARDALYEKLALHLARKL